MDKNETLACIRGAADALRRVRGELIGAAPDMAGTVAPGIEAALRELRSVTRGAPFERLLDDGSLTASLGDLQAELTGVGALLTQASAIENAWLRTAGLLAAGYTAAGEASMLRPKSRLRVNV